jgi:phosphatidylethanolamine/phosphatidyl-N-methylethanolamine N-methyltransferase
MKAQKEPKMIERVYGKIGPIYNFIYGKLLFNEGRSVAIKLLEIKRGARILEVGVGTGLTLPLYPHECTITGIDLSESMLKEAEVLMEDRGITNAKVRIMDATKLEFPDNSFDGVLGNLFISATTYPEKSLEEMRRVCKPGGIIVLMNHFRSDNKLVGAVENALNPLAQRLGFTSNLEMEPLLGRVGMKAKKVQKVNALNLWTAVSMVNDK